MRAAARRSCLWSTAREPRLCSLPKCAARAALGGALERAYSTASVASPALAYEKAHQSYRIWRVAAAAPLVVAAAAAAAEQNDEARRPLCASRVISQEYVFCGAGPVGHGNQATVSVAVHRLTGKAVAVKTLPRSTTTADAVREEVEMLRLAGRHRNVVTLQDVYSDSHAHYLVMELARGGEIYRRLSEKGGYPEGQACRIMNEVMQAVNFLHQNGMVHLDIKPENVLLVHVGDDRTPEVRLADFGSAFCRRRVRSRRAVTVGSDDDDEEGDEEEGGYYGGYGMHARRFTAAYSSPEMLLQGIANEKSDMWALGCLMVVLLSGRHPFSRRGADPAELVCAPPDLSAPAWRHVSPEAKDLVRQLLSKDPRRRPAAAVALAHPWFNAVVARGSFADDDEEDEAAALA